MRVLLVEDEYPDRLVAERLIEEALPGAMIQVVKTEQEFHAWTGRKTAEQPDLIVLDVMLPWSLPSVEGETAPEEVMKAGPLDAGIRCLKMLKASEDLNSIPVILLTRREITCPPEASACISKMDIVDRFVEVARMLVEKRRAAGHTT